MLLVRLPLQIWCFDINEKIKCDNKVVVCHWQILRSSYLTRKDILSPLLHDVFCSPLPLVLLLKCCFLNDDRKINPFAKK